MYKSKQRINQFTFPRLAGYVLSAVIINVKKISIMFTISPGARQCICFILYRRSESIDNQIVK